MGCIYPIRIKNEKYNTSQVFRTWNRKQFFYVPCGKCLGCMIAKRQWLQTACDYEYNKYGIGSFTTLTYDEEHYLHLYDEEVEDFRADYRDFQLFMKRLRKNLYDKYGKTVDFKYLVVNEYGGKTGRIHFHVLFFGLDYKREDMMIWNAWNQGIADNRPIRSGGISYVLKYMDKNELRRKQDYKFKEYQEPFIKYSKGLGKGFIDEHLEEIIKNDGCYDKGDGVLRSLPSYWLNKLCVKPITDYNEIRKEMMSLKCVNYEKAEQISKREVLMYMKRKTELKEEMLIQKARDDRKPQEDIDRELHKELWENKILEV